MLQPVKAAPYFTHVQFSRPEGLLALPDPGPDLVLVKTMWHYARATGFARTGALADSRKDIDAIALIERSASLQLIAKWGVPAQDIVRTARAVASGRLAAWPPGRRCRRRAGDLPGAIKSYQEALALQDGLPYTEAPYWYYPVRLDQAEQAFRTSLVRTPSNGWALRGLMELYRQRGDAAALAAAQKRFATTWPGKPGAPALAAL